jgi:hypothetical protein
LCTQSENFSSTRPIFFPFFMVQGNSDPFLYSHQRNIFRRHREL